MASPYRTVDVDLDALFMLRGSTTPRANTGYMIAGVDLSDRYMASTYSVGGPDDRIASNTGYAVDGVDIRDLFRALTFNTPLEITQHPQHTTFQIGFNFFLNVIATGSGTITYQWRKNGVDIPGATSSGYGSGTGTMADVGDYDCVVSNGTNTVTSFIGQLRAAPNVTSSVPNGTDTKAIGEAISLSVTAEGSGTLAYQWRKDAVPIFGATSTTFNKTVALGDDGIWNCVVTSEYGTAGSLGYILTVGSGAPPTINIHPASATVTEGDNHTLSVSASGSGPLTYQWRKNGVNIPGATSSSLSFTPANRNDIGQYSCSVTNSAGTTPSLPATFDVQYLPSITAQPQPQGGIEGDQITFSIGVAAGNPPSTSYQWQRDIGAGFVNITGGKFIGYNTSTLTFDCDFDDDLVPFRCVVSNSVGSVTSNAENCVVNELLEPLVISDPENISATSGDGPLALHCRIVKGSGTNYFTWKRNGVTVAGPREGNIPGTNGTEDQHVLNPIQLADDGIWQCFITTSYGLTAHSSTALVEVSPPAAPVITGGSITGGPYELETGNVVNFTVTATGSDLHYQWKKNGVNIGFDQANHTFTAAGPGDSGTYSVVVSNEGGSDSDSAELTINDP